MNKKILVVSILAVFTLVAISFATAVSSNTAKSVEKKESPLFGIRTRRAIGERLERIIDYIKTKFLGDRIFFLPFLRSLQHLSIRQRLGNKGIISIFTGCPFITECQIITCAGCGYTRCTQCSQPRLETYMPECTMCGEPCVK